MDNTNLLFNHTMFILTRVYCNNISDSFKVLNTLPLVYFEESWSTSSIRVNPKTNVIPIIEWKFTWLKSASTVILSAAVKK